LRVKWSLLLSLKRALWLLGVAAMLATGVSASEPKAERLVEKHKAAGLECLQCHKTKPGAPVAATVCAECHGDIAKTYKVKGEMPNPHKSHMSASLVCTDCHHMHKPSEMKCDKCHDFEFQVP